MSSESCDADVYKYGRSIGLFDMKKTEAEEACKKLTESTGFKHDWHFVAGRVNIKVLDPANIPTTL